MKLISLKPETLNEPKQFLESSPEKSLEFGPYPEPPVQTTQESYIHSYMISEYFLKTIGRMYFGTALITKHSTGFTSPEPEKTESPNFKDLLPLLSSDEER